MKRDKDCNEERVALEKMGEAEKVRAKNEGKRLQKQKMGREG